MLMMLDYEYINDLNAQRHAARMSGDYAVADKLRSQMQAMGVKIVDTKTESRWIPVDEPNMMDFDDFTRAVGCYSPSDPTV